MLGNGDVSAQARRLPDTPKLHECFVAARNGRLVRLRVRLDVVCTLTINAKGGHRSKSRPRTEPVFSDIVFMQPVRYGRGGHRPPIDSYISVAAAPYVHG